MTLSIENLTFGYARGEPVLRAVNAAFAPGRITAILGPNGAGKSTLLRAALGLVKPWSGRATMHGVDVRALRAARRAGAMAYVPQRPDAVGGFTAREVIAMGRHALARDPAAVDRAIESLELAPLAERVFARLSVGQQQRVALARALAQLSEPSGSALLADEPFSAMDPRFVDLAASALRDLAARGCSVVVILHDATTALRLADAALLLAQNGEVGAHGAAGETLTPGNLSALFGATFETVGPSAVLPVLRGAPGRYT